VKFSISNVNKYTFILLYALVFVFIGYKVFHIPITHDEVATTVFYSKFNAWEIMLFPDPWPNNHILNTLLTKGFLFLFGSEQWVVRMPNLLSFILYGFAAYRILKNVLTKESSFFIAGALLFIANPYLLDFFGLSRGYGMSAALCTLSVSYLISGFKGAINKHIWWAFVLSILASYANFTLLVFWAATTLLVAFYFLSTYRDKKTSLLKPWLILLAVCLGYLALIASPVYKMQSTNQFEFWTSSGFVADTLLPLVKLSLYDSKVFMAFNLIAGIVIGILVVNSLFVLITFKRAKFKINTLSQPLFVATSVILLTAGINMLQCWILDTPNLYGRTALFFYPLFIVALISSHEMFTSLKARKIKVGFSILLILVCVFQLLKTIKLDSVKEWRYDADTFKVLDYLEENRGDRNVTLETNWQFHPSFLFYEQTDKVPWLELKAYSKSVVPETDAEYYYIFEEDFPALESEFEPVAKFENHWLLKRKPEQVLW